MLHAERVRRVLVREAADRLIARGAEIIIAGCTEVPLVIGPGDLAVPLIDSTDILPQRAVAHAYDAAA